MGKLQLFRSGTLVCVQIRKLCTTVNPVENHPPRGGYFLLAGFSVGVEKKKWGKFL